MSAQLPIMKVLSRMYGQACARRVLDPKMSSVDCKQQAIEDKLALDAIGWLYLKAKAVCNASFENTADTFELQMALGAFEGHVPIDVLIEVAEAQLQVQAQAGAA